RRRGERPLGRKMQIRVRLRVLRLGEAESLPRQLDGAEVPLTKAALDFVDGQRSNIHERSITLGTLKYPAPLCGALARGASAPSGVRSWSARKVAVSSAA